MSYFPKSEEDENYEKVEEAISRNDLSGEDVLRLITNYHGLDIIDGFIEYLENEGYSI